MDQIRYRISVRAEDENLSDQDTKDLSTNLSELKGVVEIRRIKDNTTTMDLGTTIAVIATSATFTSLAQGIAEWLRRRRGTNLTVTRDLKSDSLKAQISNIDPATAIRITEIIQSMDK
jgi:hypothetical protein